MANGKVFFVLEGAGGELARSEGVRVVQTDGHYLPDNLTPHLIDWLTRASIVLTEGDRIDIVWQED